MEDFRNTVGTAQFRRKIRLIPNCQLRRERELRGWSQIALARKIDAQPNLVSRWETGAAFPSPHYRAKLCELFCKDAEALGILHRTPSD